MVHWNTRLQPHHQACTRKDPHCPQHAIKTTQGRSRETGQCRHHTPPPLDVCCYSQCTRWHAQGEGEENAMEAQSQDGTMVWHPRSWKTTRRLCQGRETSGTHRIGTKTRTHGAISQHPNCQTPRKGQHPHPCLPTLLVARDEYLDRELCHWVCTLPTKQNMHHQEEDSTVLHPRQPLHMPIQHHHPRPHHPATKSKWT